MAMGEELGTIMAGITKDNTNIVVSIAVGNKDGNSVFVMKDYEIAHQDFGLSDKVAINNFHILQETFLGKVLLKAKKGMFKQYRK